MKRSGPLRRTSPLGRGAGSLSRSTPLRVGVGAVRAFQARARRNTRRREPLPHLLRELALQRTGGRCLMCGRSEAEVGRLHDVHHVLPVRLFPELERELSNLVALDRECHQRHEAAFTRIPRDRLPMNTLALAAGHPDREAYMERTYP